MMNSLEDRLQTILSIVQGISVCDEADRPCPILLEKLSAQMGAAGGSIYLVRGDGLALMHSLDQGHSAEWIAFPLRTGSPFQRVLETRQPLITDEIDSLAGLKSSGWDGYTSGSFLVLPMINKEDQPLGIISLHNKADSPFREYDKTLGMIIIAYTCEILHSEKLAQELSVQELKYRHLVENGSDIVWTADLTGRLTYASSAEYTTRGYHPEEVLGQAIWDQLTPESSAKAMELLESHLARISRGEIAADQNVIVELEEYRADGSIMPVEINCSLVLDEAGQPMAINGVTREITERKRVERLQREARKIQAISALAGGLAHGFSNLLFVVTGNIEMAKSAISSRHEAQAHLADAEWATLRCSRFAQQLAVLSGRKTPDSRAVDLVELLEEFSKTLVEVLPSDTQLESATTVDQLVVNTDPEEMTRFLFGICLSLRNSSVEGGVIQLSVQEIELVDALTGINAVAAPGRYAMISVLDDRQGLDPGALEELLDPYSITSEASFDIGLTLTNVVFTQLMGTWTIDGEDNGTQIRLYLPYPRD